MGAETVDLTVDKQTFKGFDADIQKKGELFVQEMKNAEGKDKKGESKEKVDAFILNSGIVLNLILGDISDATKFDIIDATNAKEPKLQTYKDAKVAFEMDMKALNVVDEKIVKLLGDIQNIIDLKEIEANPTYVKDFDKGKIMALLALTKIPATQKILTEKLTSLESKETDIFNSLLNAAPSREIADNLFEKNQTARNVLLMKNRKQTDTDKTQEQKNFEKLLKFYGESNQEVESYEVKNYDKSGTPNPKYNYIQVKFKEIPAVAANTATGKKEIVGVKERTEDIMFGASTDIVHTARSEVYEGVWDDSIDIKENIKTLDNNGSYREFEDIIKNQIDPANFLSGLLGKGLLEDISKYKSSSDQDTKTNGYYGVILDYITETKNELLLNTYLNNVIVGDAINLKYLGTNPKSQIENFNKIVNKNTWNIDKTSNNGKLLERIRLQLANVDKKTFQETLSKGLDALIETFGPMLFSVLKMFGMGKGSLLKMFGKGYEKKINEIYKKEYELSGEQIENINKIVESENKSEPIFSKEGEGKRLETGADMEKAFQEKKKPYIDLITEEGYYKSINVNVLQKGLNSYNKEKNKELNINDIVVITTDSTTKKQSISEIRGDFKGVMEHILEDNSTRETIAGSNQEIKTDKEDKDGSKIGNEQGLKTSDERYPYIISSQQDIARYLTASLFSDKDLGYVMTENNLNNGKEMPKDQDKSKEQAETAFENKIKELGTKLDNINDKGMYGKLDTNTFTGKEKTDDGLDYKNNIISPLKDSFIGKTEAGGKEYSNYNFLLDHTKGLKDNKINENIMIGIKNMLKIEDKAEYKATIDAIQTGNTYEISVVDNKLRYSTKNSSGKETGIITLEVINGTINTKRNAAEAKENPAESKAEATPQKAAAATTTKEKTGATEAEVVTK